MILLELFLSELTDLTTAPSSPLLPDKILWNSQGNRSYFVKNVLNKSPHSHTDEIRFRRVE
jgi:hypothetical protein